MADIHDEHETCPVCGKRFLPAPMHVYKINLRIGRTSYSQRLVCSWHCLSEWRKSGKCQIKSQKKLKNKLDKDKAIEIKKLYNTGEYSQRELADKFGVSKSTISRVINGTSWR